MTLDQEKDLLRKLRRSEHVVLGDNRKNCYRGLSGASAGPPGPRHLKTGNDARTGCGVNQDEGMQSNETLKQILQGSGQADCPGRKMENV